MTLKSLLNKTNLFCLVCNVNLYQQAFSSFAFAERRTPKFFHREEVFTHNLPSSLPQVYPTGPGVQISSPHTSVTFVAEQPGILTANRCVRGCFSVSRIFMKRFVVDPPPNRTTRHQGGPFRAQNRQRGREKFPLKAAPSGLGFELEAVVAAHNLKMRVGPRSRIRYSCGAANCAYELSLRGGARRSR